MYTMTSPMAAVFKRVSSFFTPPVSYTEPFTPPIPVQYMSFDSILKEYLDAELDAYMSCTHKCTSCKQCWPSHKKTAIRLLKLHPLTYKALEE